MLEDLSLSGNYVNGNAPVSVEMALALPMFAPGDPEPLLIDRAIVQWVKGSEFGVDFGMLQAEAGGAIQISIWRGRLEQSRSSEKWVTNNGHHAV